MMLAHLLAKGGKQEHRLPMRADAWQLFRGCLDYLGALHTVFSMDVAASS